jgi:hypothetical protein
MHGAFYELTTAQRIPLANKMRSLCRTCWHSKRLLLHTRIELEYWLVQGELWQPLM